MNKPLRTAVDALAAWDAGEELIVFSLESEGTPQGELWRQGFELIRAGINHTPLPSFAGLSDREKISVESLATVALDPKTVWASMITRHTDAEHSPAIGVTKPRDPLA